MQQPTETRDSNNKPALMAPTSSTEHSGELVDRHHHPLADAVVKRKRTKRPRHHPPASSSASSSESTTTEEEDMAHCLILLAQGGGAAGAVVVDSKPSSPASTQPTNQPSPPPTAVVAPPHPPPGMRTERYTSRKYTEAATTADGVKAGFYVYECRTCNKCFPTFQALGGHRASHKKTRLGPGDDETINVVTKQQQEEDKPPMATAMASSPLALPPPRPDVTTALSLNSNSHHVVAAATGSSKLRVHECSICGAEFSSGQALGGHMRRHRPLNAPPERAVATSNTVMMKKEGSASINLELDLNLPAPSDEEAVSLPAVVLGLGQFNDGKKAGLMLTASALVDCHY